MHTPTIWNRVLSCLAAIMLIGLMGVTATAQVPPKPDPPRLVNDFAGILNDCQWLEDSLERIANETSNQICVVTMNDFGGYDRAVMAQKIGEQWGVGSKERHNGVVILIKPKTENGKGEAFIATGFGLEDAITDGTCTQIVNREMIPHFKENDYLAGAWAGAQVVRDLAVGKYNQEEYEKSGNGRKWWGWLLAIVTLIVYCIVKYDIFSFFGSGGDADDSTGTAASSGTLLGEQLDDSMDNRDEEDEDDDDYLNNSSNDDSSWDGFGGGSFGGHGGGGEW